ncbi:hypothetical protein PGB28_13645 [Primorskyibacter aestuariivivens]|uniref:hypothetical protein n=1 Tax=Primorskyibacter aestuariivivens TaxID=1888912 RepID=UPI0022FFE7CD|nr:hypothetical protein [Primorskyibacter aestuariivivens]MDA7429508.1 hypothetical protein [Primorskyibacter aestuariivivens]
MTHHRNQPQFSELDFMMLRAGWDPKLNTATTPKLRDARPSVGCSVCLRLAALFHAGAARLESRAEHWGTKLPSH